MISKTLKSTLKILTMDITGIMRYFEDLDAIELI